MRQRRNWTKRIVLTGVLLTSLTLSVVLAGCSTTSCYVLDQQELVKVKSGDVVTAKFDGWLMSNRAVDRVMDAKIMETKLK